MTFSLFQDLSESVRYANEQEEGVLCISQPITYIEGISSEMVEKKSAQRKQPTFDKQTDKLSCISVSA